MSDALPNTPFFVSYRPAKRGQAGKERLRNFPARLSIKTGLEIANRLKALALRRKMEPATLHRELLEEALDRAEVDRTSQGMKTPRESSR